MDDYIINLIFVSFQNGTNEFNSTSDGFLSQILNDDNFQLMDIAMNEG